MKNKKIIFVTGGASGIGKETVMALSKTGLMVVFTARDGAVGEEIKNEIVSKTGNGDVDYIICNLASFRSVKECTNEFLRRFGRLDVLINNAGVFPQERQESSDGIELNLAVNFLAPMLLTRLLLPLLKKCAPSRIVNVASSMYKEGEINFEDLEGKIDFNKYAAYAQSKLALLLFTRLLAIELKGSGVTVNALHPGVVSTEMTMQNVRKMNPLSAFLFRRTLISPEKGAATSVYLAISAEVANVSGEYFEKCKRANTTALAEDMLLAKRLVTFVEDKYLASYFL